MRGEEGKRLNAEGSGLLGGSLGYTQDSVRRGGLRGWRGVLFWLRLIARQPTGAMLPRRAASGLMWGSVFAALLATGRGMKGWRGGAREEGGSRKLLLALLELMVLRR